MAEEFSIKGKLQQLADALNQEPEVNRIEDLLHDYPIFLELTRNDLLLTTAVITLTLLPDQEEMLNLLPELPEDLDNAITLMSVPQMQVMLHWMGSQLQAKPIPCDLCSAPADPISGFCDQCDRLLNSPAVAQVFGGWEER